MRNNCLECERVTRFMANDPAFYRDEPRLCIAHLELDCLKEKLLVTRATLVKAKEGLGYPIVHPLIQELFTEIRKVLMETNPE